MTTHRTRIGLLSAAIAILALPATDAAASYVPPGNSAATQYTEAVPTVGGPKSTSNSKGGKSKSPSKVLGSRNTEKLDEHGPQGRAAAEVAAETAPAAVATATSEPEPGKTAGPETSGQTGNHATQGAKSGAAGAAGTTTGHEAASPAKAAQTQIPGGSSGFGQVIDQATGSPSSGQLGALLPLLIAAVVVWSIAYVVRQQRKRPAG